MSYPEIKVGQKWCIVDAAGFACPYGSQVGDVLQIVKRADESGSWRAINLSQHFEANVIFYKEDVEEGFVELMEDVEDPTEASDDVSELPYSEAPEEVESYSQESTETPQEILDAAHTCVGVSRSSVDSSEGIRMYKNTNYNSATTSGQSAELLWKFIEGGSEYNGHKSLEVGELSFEHLKDIVKGLGYYLEEDEDTAASSLEIRLMYNGDFLASLKGTWGASVYQLGYWKTGEHPCGHTDRLLLGVDVVKGI